MAWGLGHLGVNYGSASDSRTGREGERESGGGGGCRV